MNELEQKKEESSEIDLMELAAQLWEGRKKVIRYALIGVVAGLIVAFSIPAEYTSTVKMAPEQSSGSTGMGNLGGLAAMAGFDLGAMNATDGIRVDIYPEVISSTPFMAEIGAIPVTGRRMEAPVSLYDYCKEDLRSPWWSAVLGLPGKILGAVLGGGKERGTGSDGIDPYRLTPSQDAVFRTLRQRVGIVIDKKSGIVTASAEMQDPEVAAAVADSVVAKLQKYIIDYRTDKAKLDCAFIQGLYEEARADYHEKQQRYARFVDANQHLTRESVRVEQSRLQNEQQLAYSVYSNLASQLELARIKVQEQTPSLTVIEPATVPVRKSSTSKTTILIAFTFLGALAAVAVILFREFFGKRETPAGA